MRPDKTYITHTVKPKCIIEIMEQNTTSTEEIHDTFSFSKGDQNKKYTLIAKDVFGEFPTEDIQKTITRAWRWYRSYLQTL